MYTPKILFTVMISGTLYTLNTGNPEFLHSRPCVGASLPQNLRAQKQNNAHLRESPLTRGLGFRVQGLGFRVQGLGFRVRGEGPQPS